MTFFLATTTRTTFAASLLLFLLPCAAFGQPDIYVDADANATECGSTPDGSSWSCAYPALQDAFDEVENSSPSTAFEIWVAGGTYYPDNDNVDNDGDGTIEHTAGDRTESFTLTRGDVSLYGGFDGTDGSGGGARETSRTQRNPEGEPVLLSGDVDDDNSTSGNAYHVVYLDGRTSTGTTITSNTILDGFWIVGGNANGSPPNNQGGGLYCNGADDGSGDADRCSPVLQRMVVEGNNASSEGGGMYIHAGNGGNSSPTIVHARFRDNSAEDGGAIFNNGDATSATANGVLVNVTFFENVAGKGGAIFNDADQGTADLKILNATFAGNKANDGVTAGGEKGGSAIISRRANLEVRNSIFWDHATFTIHDPTTSSPVIAHSIVEGGESNVNDVDYQSSNLDADPRYLGSNGGAGSDGTWGTSEDDLQRNWASAAIDNGDAGAVPPDTTDVDGDGNTSELVPDLDFTSRRQGKTVDIGAYERGGVEPKGGMAHVDQSASGAQSGGSWVDAYTSLQAGLRANENAQASSSPGDVTEVRVAEGTYTPTRRRDATDARSRTFYIDGDNVEVYAGYPSGGGTRDPDANPVLLSGDLDDNDDAYAPQTDSDGDGSTPSQTDHLNGANAYSVLFLDAASTDLTASTILDGVTVTAGFADGEASPSNRGGGLFCRAGSGQTCSPSLRGVTFYGNHASAAGGAIYNDAGGTASPALEGVIFRGNATDGNGGALANDAKNGSGTASPSLTNATVVANAALGNGGGLWNHAATSGETASPSVTNVSFTGNSADNSGGALYNDATNGTSSPTIVNAILWNNGDEVAGTGAAPTINHSIVAGGCPASADCSGGNLLSEDPQFADPDGDDGALGTADDDLRLQGPGSLNGASAAIDAGNNDVIAASLDLGGNTRRQDVSAVMDTGSPAGDSPYVDMGAFESSGSPLPVELATFTANADGKAVTLSWTTASEQNNAGFYVQRRTADSTFATLDGAFVEGAGTTNESQTYSYRVEDLEAGTHTFRLKQVDTDGSSTFSDPVEVKIGLSGDYQLSTYPNPVQTQGTVEFAVKEQSDVTITLYNTLGQKVRTVYRGTPTAEETKRVQIDTRDLSSGAYFLRLQGEGVTGTERVTVVK